MNARKVIAMLIAAVFSLSIFQTALAQKIHTLPTIEVYPVSCDMGCYVGHSGTDYQTGYDRKVSASADGTVEITSDTNAPNDPNLAAPNSQGNYIIINHGSHGGVTVKTHYYHLKSGTFTVRIGQDVIRGQTIALTGNSGTSTGPHLHFEIKHDGVSVDPYNSNNSLWLTNPPSTVVGIVGRRSTGPDPNQAAFLGCFMSNGGYDGLGGVWDNGPGDIYVHYWPDNGNPNQAGSTDALLVQDLLKVKRDSKGTDNTSDDTFTYSWSQLVRNPRVNQTICVKEEILSCWNSNTGYATLGAPTSVQYYPQNGRKQQNFEKGFIWAENGVAHMEFGVSTALIQSRQVTINTAPQGAEIWNSGMSLGNAPVVGQFYQGYSYNMTAKKDGYQDKAFSFTVGSSDMTVNVTLTAGSGGGSTSPNYIITKALTCKSVDANGYYVNDESEFTGSDTYAYGWVWLSNYF